MRALIGLVVIIRIAVVGIPAIMAWGNNGIMRDVVITVLGYGDSQREKR